MSPCRGFVAKTCGGKTVTSPANSEKHECTEIASIESYVTSSRRSSVALQRWREVAGDIAARLGAVTKIDDPSTDAAQAQGLKLVT